MKLLTLKDVAEEKDISYRQAAYRVRRGDLVPDQRLGLSYLFARSTVDAFDMRACAERRRALRSRPASLLCDMIPIAGVAVLLGVPLRQLNNAISRGDVTIDGKASGVRYLTMTSLEVLQRNPELLRRRRKRARKGQQSQ